MSMSACAWRRAIVAGWNERAIEIWYSGYFGRASDDVGSTTRYRDATASYKVIYRKRRQQFGAPGATRDDHAM
jgi:hypothetical protein